MALSDMLVGLTPLIALLAWFAWKGIPTFLAWRGERKYQAEWRRTFRDRRREASASAVIEPSD